MNKGSAYWLNNQLPGNFNLIELANTQSAISNFVKILTGKEIPIEFYENNMGDSMTNGKKITISSTINTTNLDSIIGLALHEGAHCKYTDFTISKKISNYLIHKNLIGGKGMILIFLNFVEDRRIDNLVYKSAPGYQDYYRAMYNRYFYNNTVNKGLKSKEYREENWESYLFRIINIFNKNTEFDALCELKRIYNLIDLKNIDRLKNTENSLELAIEIYKHLNDHFAIMKPKDRKDQALRNKQKAKNNTGPSKEVLKKVFRKQEQFLEGNIHKSHTSVKDKKQIEVISKSKINIKNINIPNTKNNTDFSRTLCPVHIIDGITPIMIENNLYDIFHQTNFRYKNEVKNGINLGKKLLRKLQIRNEQITLASKRLKQGKIDSRRIYAANFEDDLFYKIDRSNYKPISLHVSIDGSGSMEGAKWKQVLINTIALGYISLKMNNINLTISIRTTGKHPNRSSKTEHIPLLILAFNSKKHTLKDLKRLVYYKVSGLTPEGMCLNALNEYIPNSSYYLDSYLINMSDGYPTFESSQFEYKNKEAILDTSIAVKNIKKKNIKILSYFIQSSTTSTKDKELVNNFKIMYGKEASFINSKNINEVTKTLNNLFLEKNLIS